MENKTNQFNINKEVKRHKSAIIPPGPDVNNYILKDNSSTESNKTISTNEDGVFKLKVIPYLLIKNLTNFLHFVIMRLIK